MDPTNRKHVTADVICQHKRDGTIIPIKIRIADDDGELQTFQIKAFRNLSSAGTVCLPNEVPVTAHMKYFECKIVVFNREKQIRLIYNTYDGLWSVYYF